MVSSVHWSKSLAHLLFSLTLFKLRWGTWPKMGSEVPGETRGWGASIRKRDEGRERESLTPFLLSWIRSRYLCPQSKLHPRTAEGARTPWLYWGANQSLCCPPPCFLYKQYLSFWFQEHSANTLICSQREIRAGHTECLKGCQETPLWAPVPPHSAGSQV